MIVAQLDDVTVRRAGRLVLDGVSLRIERGERIALLGPNGAGKTTLLRVIAGLDRPDEGRVVPASSGVGYVPQAYAASLFPWFTVERNVAMPLLVKGRPDALDVSRELCACLLPRIDPKRRAMRLSGGEAQAVAIARALAAPGELVLADEPFSALSASMRADVVGWTIERLRGRALLLVTHASADVVALCDRAIELGDGRLVDVELPRESA